MFVENIIISIHYCSCCADGTDYYKISASNRDDFIKILSFFGKRKMIYKKGDISISDQELSLCDQEAEKYRESLSIFNKNVEKINDSISKEKRELKIPPFMCKEGYKLTDDQIKTNEEYKKVCNMVIGSLNILLEEEIKKKEEFFKLDKNSSYEKYDPEYEDNQ